MNAMTPIPASTSQKIVGQEHWTSKGGGAKLFLWEKCAGDPAGPARHHPVRARLVDGLAADLRPAGAGPAAIRRRWTGSPRAASTPGRVDMEGYGRSDQGSRHQRRRSREGADDSRGRHRLHPEAPRQPAAAGLRHLVGRAARRAVRAAPSRDRSRGSRSTPIVWTGEGSPTLAERRKKLPEFSGQEPPADRPRLRALDLRPRPSRHRRRRRRSRRSPTRSSRSTIRCRPAPTSTCAPSCRWSIPTKIKVPTIVMRGEYDGIAASTT